jgi:glyoxylase-like metal-dependent hydrolase (beta-lactamase superfamily II)
MSRWFEIRQVNPRLWMIAEPLHVVSWLYLGTARAALIDTGMGIASIAAEVAAITALPVTVINTHYHFDHIGGNAEFATRLAGENAAPLLARPASRNLLDRYLRGFESQIATAAAARLASPDVYALAPETEARPWPETFNQAAWHPGRIRATGLLREGDQIELGGASLTVINTPGHSPDSISLFDEQTGILFAGDMLTEGPLYGHYDESSLPDFLDSAAKLCRLGDAVRMICASHTARAIAETSLIAQTQAALKTVSQGTAKLEPATDIFGYPILEARLGRVWVTQPSGACSYDLYD